MTTPVIHSTFTIERNYKASPARVFAALTQLEHLKHWFGGPPEWSEEKITIDFRVGGKMTSSGGPKGGAVISFESRYYDIAENERIVYAYDMNVGDRRISVSLATFVLHPEGNGTRLVLTEQGAYFDDPGGPAGREQGTRELLETLGRYVDNNYAGASGLGPRASGSAVSAVTSDCRARTTRPKRCTIC